MCEVGQGTCLGARLHIKDGLSRSSGRGREGSEVTDCATNSY